MSNTSNNNLRKNNLPLTQQSTKNRTTRKYVDKDGWTVIESTGPGTRTVIRYNPGLNKMTMVINTESVYTGSYNEQYLNILERNLRHYEKLMDDQMTLLDRKLGYVDHQLDDLDRFLDEDFFSDSFLYSDVFDDSALSSSRRQEKSPKKSGYGLGCLFWSILAFLAVCFIIFGMGAIGKVIIDALASLF